jgi:hypothetical protein
VPASTTPMKPVVQPSPRMDSALVLGATAFSAHKQARPHSLEADPINPLLEQRHGKALAIAFRDSAFLMA